MSEVATKPCLVQTGQGFSVSYNGRFLYSKYAPKKAIAQTVANLSLLPGTLILCASPCLWYGLPELLQKLPADCFVLGIEVDAQLYEVAKAELEKIRTASEGNFCGLPTTQAQDARQSLPVALLFPDELFDIVEIISSGKTKHDAAWNFSFPPIHRFRRAIMLEMSGGTAFYADTYKKIAFAAENTIATFWKNRLTLTKLGRLFSRNVFHNLSALPRSVPLSSYLKKICRPIVVFGAGESAGKTIASVPRTAWQDCYVLCVDAALSVLKASKIKPDGIVAVESQLAIEKAYIGYTDSTTSASNRNQCPTLFSDMSSRKQVTTHTGGNVVYFASEFARTHFLEDLQTAGLLPPQIPALGSVGLTAVYLALQLRATTDIPVYVTGLDFSFSLGATHTRGAPAHTARLCSANRLRPLANYDAAFRTGAQFVQGKNGGIFTDTALSGYAQQFAGVFAGTKNLFDIGESGLDLGIVRRDLNFQNHGGSHAKPDDCPEIESDDFERLTPQVTAFFAEERKALFRLKDLLVNGDAARSKTMTVQEEIGTILARREYLYLHFPDGYECKPSDISFLKRVRSEIDFFLKDMRD
ncbi:MAG: DUF115 domain-containing protein [Treponema sp.]|nr:DUF115 domain-containing protein [Treponema sp.]